MKIILLRDIHKLGVAGDIVKVANGYGRNYLLPKNFAILATKGNVVKIETIKGEAEKVRTAITIEQKELAEKMNDIILTFKRKIDENQHLYGSVSEVDIQKELKNMGFKISKSNIKLEAHIKELGAFDVEINLASEISSKIKVNVEEE